MNNPFQYRFVAFCASVGVHTLFASAYYFCNQGGVSTAPTVSHSHTFSVHFESGNGGGHGADTNKENAPGFSKPKLSNHLQKIKTPACLKNNNHNTTHVLQPDPLNTYPEYSQVAKTLNLEAKMFCTLHLKIDGSVHHLSIENEIDHPAELVQITKAALKQWKYKSPHSLEGVKIRVPIDFSLQD